VSTTEILSQISSAISFLGENHWALSFCIVTCCFSLFVLFFHSRKVRTLGAQVKRLENDLKVARSSAVAMGKEIIHLEKQVKNPTFNAYQKPLSQTIQFSKDALMESEKLAAVRSMNRPVQKGEKTAQAVMQSSSSQEADQTAEANQTTGDSQSVYDDARHYLSQGNEVGEVASKCGLSYAEVSLLKALSNPGAISKSTL
jgi:outer membrane murein-binding lipoprotein Lpp